MESSCDTRIQRKTPMGVLLLLILTIPLTFTGCKGTEIGGSWAEKPITIDGDFRDWDNHPTLLLEEQSAVVGQCNDGENLYLLFRTSDPSWAMAIKKTGLTLYFDSQGKKNKDFMICFKDGPARGMPQTGMDQNRQRPQNDLQDRPQRPEQNQPQGESSKSEFTCSIKDFLVEKIIPLDGSEGPSACFDTCLGFYTYEFKIPLQQSQTRYYGIDTKPGQTVGLGAVWGDMGDMPERPGGGGGGMGGGMGGGPPGGGGGGRGGMGGGPGGGMGGPPGGGDRPDMPEKQEVWFKAPLSTDTPTAEE